MKVTIRSLMLLAVLVAIPSFCWHRKAKNQRAAMAEAVQNLVNYEADLHHRAIEWDRQTLTRVQSGVSIFMRRKATEARATIEGICERWNLEEPAPSFWSPSELDSPTPPTRQSVPA